MSNAGDKFQLVTDPFMPPQKCASCNTQKIGLYIDFGLTIKRYGRIYFCKECLIEASATINMPVPVSSHLEELEKLREENANLNHLLIVDLHGLKSYLDSVLPESKGNEQLEPTIVKSVKGRPRGSSGTKPGITKQNSE